MAKHPDLTSYRAKRNFAITGEPCGAEDLSAGPHLSFVIQKHWATRLHYDFRLELDGALKSWAVPKGPSYDPAVKRMAVEVEDHPLSYAGFEGTIPARQYGAGKVIVWDKGIWIPLGDARKGLRAGNLKFEMHGLKMQGKWALVRMKTAGKKPAWLLIKERDDYARAESVFSLVDEFPDSVAQLEAPHAAHAAAPPGASKAALPDTLKPELATLVSTAPASDDWLFEIKFDGYRILTRIEQHTATLHTRNGHDWSERLQPLQRHLSQLGLPDGWYDGEITALDDAGLPDFGQLQLSIDNAQTEHLVYYLFDLPYSEGYDLRRVALEDRRARLEALLRKTRSDTVKFSAALAATGEQALAASCRMGLEGAIGKRRGSLYTSKRSPDWIKLKCEQRQEFVVGGYTDPKGTREALGSLLLGVYGDAVTRGHGQARALHYSGSVGTGFSAATLQQLKQKLDALTATRSPFAPDREIPRQAHFVKPELVVEVSFAAWTDAGHLRHPVFHGLRSDIQATAIHRESPREFKEMTTPHRGASRAQATLPPELRVTHAQRVIDAHTRSTKLDLIQYYAQVSTLMLPHLKERPVALVRAPAGIGGQLFFQKHAEKMKLAGIAQLDPELHEAHPPMLEVHSAQGLLSAAQWNVVEFHTWNAVASSLDLPDRMVFDLDPGKNVDWSDVQEAAQLMHSALDTLGLPAYLKTSGGKGLHVVVPIRKQYDWDTVKGFSQALVQHLARLMPERFVARSGPRNRVGRIFIDYLRNGFGATTACAWSARARPGLGISVPIGWDELSAVSAGDQWTIATVHERLDRGNTPWLNYAKSARTLTPAMKTLGFEHAAARPRAKA